MKVPPYAQVFWQQPPDRSVNHHNLNIIHLGFASQATQKTEGLQNMQLSDVANQTLPQVPTRKSATSSKIRNRYGRVLRQSNEELTNEVPEQILELPKLNTRNR